MTALAIAFAVEMLLFGAAMLVARVLVMRAEDRLVQRRLDEVSPTPLSLVPEDRLSEPGLARGPVQMVIDVLAMGTPRSWDSHIPPAILLLWALGAAFLCWLALGVGLRLTVFIWGPLTILGMLAPPQLLLRLEQGRIGAKFVDLFPEAIDMMVRMLRAGLPVSVAIRIVGVEAGSPVKEVFAHVGERIEIGSTFEDALRKEAQRIAVPDFRFFAVATALQQSTGGNLAVSLEILSEIIRKRRSGRMKAKAVTAEIRMSTMVLASVPFALIGGLLFLRPDYLTPLIVDRRGNVILAAAVLSLVTGLFVMGRMTKNATRI